MDVAIIYESRTGTTRRAALAMAEKLYTHRIRCHTFPVLGIDHEVVAAADLVIVGSWTDGLLVVGQRPGRSGRLRSHMPSLSGKRCAVFCTYAVTPGATLDKLDSLVDEAGGQVLGGLAIRRDRIDAGARELVDALLDAAMV